MPSKVTVKGEGAGLEAITMESDPTTIVSVVKTGKKSGKKRVSFAISEPLGVDDTLALNRGLRKAGIPLVYAPENNEVVHTRTGLAKEATSDWWVTPQNVRKTPANGR